MSKEGIEIFACTMSIMQSSCRKLMKLGTEEDKAITPMGQQDIRLSHLMNDAKCAVKDRFVKETLKDIPDQVDLKSLIENLKKNKLEVDSYGLSDLGEELGVLIKELQQIMEGKIPPESFIKEKE